MMIGQNEKVDPNYISTLDLILYCKQLKQDIGKGFTQDSTYIRLFTELMNRWKV